MSIILSKYNFIKLILLLSIILNFNSVIANISKDIDSLNKLLLKSKSDTNKVKLLLDFSEKYYNSNTKQSKEFANEAINLSDKINWIYGKNLSLLKLGKIEYLMGNFDKSLKYNLNALSFFKSINDKEGIAVSTNQVGENYSKLQKDSLAILYLNKSLEISKEIKNIVLVKTNYTNLGALSARNGQYNKALNYYFEALKIKSKDNNSNINGIINGNIGSIYLELGKFEDALKYYQKAIKINEKNEMKVSLAYNYYNLAVLYYNLGKYHEATNNFDKVINLQNFINDNSMIIDCIATKAIVLNLLGDTPKALRIFEENETKLPETLTSSDLSYYYFSYGSTLLDLVNKIKKSEGKVNKKYLKDAIINLEKAKSYLKGQDLVKSDLVVFEYLYKAYKLNNNYNLSLDNLEFYQQQSDSMYLNESLKSISEFESKLELEKKNKKLLIQKNEIKMAETKQLLITIALILTVVLLILVIYLYNTKHKSNIALTKINKEVNELNNTKDKLFSIIAHDLLNPIVNFKNVSEVLTDKYESFSADEHKEYLLLMKESSKSLLEMLRNLLDWTRSQRNKIETQIENIVINDILLENIKFAEINAVNKSIKIIYNIENDYIILGDANLITTVLRNIISNAIKFTPVGGEIKINIENLDKSILVKIIDNGIGISKEKIDNIFTLNPNNTTFGTNNEKGTGIGILLCKEFMELMNGDIIIESEIDKGTTVTLIFPN